MPRLSNRGLAHLLKSSSPPAGTHPDLRGIPSRTDEQARPASEEGRYLVLATAHLSVTTAALMDSWCNGHAHEAPILIAKNTRGWFASIWPHGAGADNLLPSDLLAAIQFARARGVGLLHFDCDGPKVAQLPVHDW